MLLNAVVKYSTNALLIAPLDETQLCFVMKQNGVVVKWRELGVQLLNTKDIHYLDEIKANHPQNVRGCCYEMFEQWLRTRLDASWDKLCNALVTIDLPVAAREIKQELSRGAYVCVYIKCMHVHCIKPFSQLTSLVIR